jgi:Tol biopolymer transport system component
MVGDPTPGATPEPVLPRKEPGPGINNPSFTPDGRFVIVSSSPLDGQEGGLYLYDVGDGDSGRPFFATEGLEGDAEIRPDGRWVVYNTNVSGRFEVYLRPLVPQNPESAPIHPVTNEGGEDPRWSADGMTVYYRNPTDRSIYAVSVRTEPQIEISRPRLLTDMEGEEWDVTPDERVVMVKNAEGAEDARPDIRVILNWD